MKRKIPNSARHQLDVQRQLALKSSLRYERVLKRRRTGEIKRVLRLAEMLPMEKWNTIPDLLDEKYLKPLYTDLYMKIGEPIANNAINNFLSQKSEFYWEPIIRSWMEKNLGVKISIIQEGLKEWLREELSQVMGDLTGSIDSMTRELFNRVSEKWTSVADWQVRRIVQTETLTASSVAGYESVKSLGIPFNKIWVNSGLSNSRDTHVEADGQVVDENEPFIVGGEQMMYPRDGSLGASAGNIINCACSHIAIPKD